MTEVFQRILSMSLSASWLILAILGLRLLLQKMPKWGNVLLWGLAALRLLLPFSIESRLSLIPGGWMTEDSPAMNHIDNPVIEGPAVSTNSDIRITTIMSIVWFVGVIMLLVYFAIRYWHLLRKVNTAILLRDNIFQSESVAAPIVVGTLNPKIYLPFKVEQHSVDYIIAHEQAHIQRRDHWWKLLGFVLLTLHWFNPLVWVAYALLCRDIEMACDEAVIRDLDNDGRADYAQALVTYSTKRQLLAVHPLAFGENAVKGRLKSIMNYRKASRWSVAFIIVSCMFLAMCFLTAPVKAAQTDMPPKIETGETIPLASTDTAIDSQVNSDIEYQTNKLKMELEVQYRQYEFYRSALIADITARNEAEENDRSKYDGPIEFYQRMLREIAEKITVLQSKLD